jgi:hypothetical protein
MRARYYISFDAITYTEFFPSNEPKVTWTREGDEIFMRPRVDKFIIGRTKNISIYDNIYQRFFDPSYFTTDINYRIQELGVTTYEFIGPILEGMINTEYSRFEAKPEPDDEYRGIMLNYETKWQDRSVAVRGDIFGTPTGNIYYDWSLVAGVWANVDYDVFNEVSKAVTWGCSAAATATLDTLTGGDIVIYITAFTGDPVKFREVSVLGVPTGVEVTITGTGIYQLTLAAEVYMDVYRSAAGGGTFTYRLYKYNLGNMIVGDLLMTCLGRVINGANHMNLGLTLTSTIISNDALPTGHAIDTPVISAYIAANPNNDYVIQAPAIWNHLWLAQPNAITDENNFVYETSLKDVMNILKYKLRMFWFIDPDGKFRVEHEKYFRDFSVQADLTAATYTPDKPEVDSMEYNYETATVYKQTNYSENNQSHEDWIPYPHIFTQKINSAVGSININVTTDIDNLFAIHASASSSGLLLIRCLHGGFIAGNDPMFVGPSNITPTTYYGNVTLGWYYILENYHNYFASAEAGTVNNTAHTFTHVKEFLKQGNIKFRMATTFDWKKPFTIKEGTGWVENAEYSPDTGMYKIDVGINPYTVPMMIVDSEDMSIQIVDNDGTTEIIE